MTSGPETPGSDTYMLDKEANSSDPMATNAGQHIAPILQKDPRTGHLSIGNFKAISMAGPQDECFGIGRSMLQDVGASSQQLSVVTSSKQIAIAKICAGNGSVILTCRAGQITVSPRRQRPDDNCSASG